MSLRRSSDHDGGDGGDALRRRCLAPHLSNSRMLLLIILLAMQLCSLWNGSSSLRLHALSARYRGKLDLYQREERSSCHPINRGIVRLRFRG